MHIPGNALYKNLHSSLCNYNRLLLYHIKMADKGRKNFGDKISDAMTPDSQKSTWDKASENMGDTYDKAASKMQPEEDKGVFQKISDTLSGKK